MAARTKRTYNLRPEIVMQVRELVGQYGATSQDAVVELAVERLYRDALEQVEAVTWAKAAEDPEFNAEMSSIAAGYRERETWPR